jgi:hypothetical protein
MKGLKLCEINYNKIIIYFILLYSLSNRINVAKYYSLRVIVYKFFNIKLVIIN